MNLLGAHIGMTFSGGLLDFVIYGLLPDVTGQASNCYWVVIVGIALIPLYYFLFRTLILKFDIKTPGREAAVKLFTKSDFKEKNEQSNNVQVQLPKDKYSALADEVVKAYGGFENIKNVDACITKLRIQVADPAKVDQKELMRLGARGVIKPSPQSVYAVFGNEADIIKNKINEKIEVKNG
jgi:glucose-like phosphotransferase system IIB component